MPGNSQRKGAIKKTGKGNPTAGSGGRVRRGLEGKGPTPKAKDRPYHQAHKAAVRAEKAKDKAKSGRGRQRNTSDAEWIAGRNSVVEALREHVPVTGVYVAEGAERDGRLREAFKLAAEQGLSLLEVSRGELDRMTGGAVHQGLAARLPSYEYAHADDLLDRAAGLQEPPLVVALDSVTDPRNLGAVIRSAAGFGAHGVLIPERRAAGMTASAWKTSAGAAARLPVAQTVNLTRQLKAYQEAGCMVVGLAADGDLTLPELVAPDGLATGPLVLVVGSEGKGLSRLVAETCDQIVAIPMSGQLESLNAGVAASVALYAISQARPRRGSGCERGPHVMILPRRLVVLVVLAAVSTTLGVAAGVGVFLSGSRTIVLAGHDSVVRGTLTGDAVLETGPLLPDFRVRDVGPIGVNIDVGKTEAASLEELLERYAFIASQPDAQVAKVTDALWDLAVRGLLAGLGVALVPVAVWLLLGPHRRGELFRGARTPRGFLGAVLLLALPVLIWQPWWNHEETQRETGRWQSLGSYVGESVPLPADVSDLEILTGPATTQTKRLALSAVDTYEKSKSFYRTAALDAAELDVRPAGEGETVALLVSDRHDNIGMDGVARAVGEAAGASVVLDGGDDTSTGQPWEAFSLDSLDETFDDWERFGVAGNHDNGGFVSRTLADKGWTMLEGEPVDAPWSGTLIGVDDPRASGLGSWRDETGLTFGEVRERLAGATCDAEERVSLMLVHDANLGREALERGCVDLVVGGHTHVQRGPDPVAGTDGAIGYTWTNGTTGGAAYAIAVGSKPRRDAEVSLITFSEGRPVGLQYVRLRTDGSFLVGEWTPIYPGAAPQVLQDASEVVPDVDPS